MAVADLTLLIERQEAEIARHNAAYVQAEAAVYE